MKQATFIALMLGAVLAFGTDWSSASLDRDGSWVPATTACKVPPVGTRSLIHDGSFELGPPPTSAWTEENNSDCERIGDFSGSWYVSAFDGTNDYWAGGYCYDDALGFEVPVISSVTQTITVPADSTVLSFHYLTFRPSADDDPADGDHAYVAIDGVEVWVLALTRANDTYPNWFGPVQVDLSDYAGQSVSLSFGAVPEGDLTGNARFDHIELINDNSPAQRLSWGEIKFVFR